MIRHAPASTLFPYTTLFRSRRGRFRRAASLGPRGRRRRRPLLRGCRLLLYAGQAATREAAHALLHVTLGIEQRRAGKHEHGVLLGQTAHHLDMIEIGKSGANLHRRRLSFAEREDDVGRWLSLAPSQSAAARAAHAARAARR